MSPKKSDAPASAETETTPEVTASDAQPSETKKPAAKKAAAAKSQPESSSDQAIEASLKSAIVDWNGKQYQLQEGRYLDIDTRLEAPDAEIVFDRVLLAQVGDKTWVGAPQVEGAQVLAKVLSHGRKAKILVYKMRCKKGYRRKNGHRQGFTRIQVTQVKVPA